MSRMKVLANAVVTLAAFFVAALSGSSGAMAAEGGGGGSGGSGGGGEVPYLVMAPFDVPIVESGSLAGHLVVELAIKARTPAAAQAMTARMPQLRSATLAAVSEFAQLYVSGYRPVRAAELRASVEAALRPRDPRIEHVLILNIMARPPR